MNNMLSILLDCDLFCKIYNKFPFFLSALAASLVLYNRTEHSQGVFFFQFYNKEPSNLANIQPSNFYTHSSCFQNELLQMKK